MDKEHDYTIVWPPVFIPRIVDRYFTGTFSGYYFTPDDNDIFKNGTLFRADKGVRGTVRATMRIINDVGYIFIHGENNS